jgi:predicted metal-dependent peptidase
MNAQQKIIKARAGLVLDSPFFASLALRMTLQEDRTAQTVWTNGQKIGFNPDFIDGLPLDVLKGVLCHEVMHIACSHNTRRGERDPDDWNKAGDYAVNSILHDCNVALPANHLYDPSFKDMAAEQIYSHIHQKPEQKPQGQGNPDPNGQDKVQDKRGDPGGCGEVRDFKGTPAEVAQAEQDNKISVQQAMTQAQAMGDLPGGLKRMVEKILAPCVNWKEVLRRFIDQSAKSDYTWTRPNRRYISAGLYLPALHSEQLPPIVVTVDTSGSIDNETLSQFASELTAILSEYKTTCTVLYCDTKVRSTADFNQEDLPVTLHAEGGGGTDFRPPFAWIEREGITPACMIYLTDLECSRFPEYPPDYPVLWAVIGDCKRIPPFGETVKIS